MQIEDTVDHETLATYDVSHMRSQVLPVTWPDKNGTITYKTVEGSVLYYGDEYKNTRAKFTSYEKNDTMCEGTYDSLSRTYLNSSPSARIDVILANYAWDTIALPAAKKENCVFIGWFRSQGENWDDFAGKAGAPFTPRGKAEVLYAVFIPDNMVIDASVADSVAGHTDVTWSYNNVSTISNNISYKIYKTVPTPESSILSTAGNVHASSVGTSATTDGTYTVPYTGIYNVSLQGAAGESITSGSTTASGGKGANLSMTMFLRAGDVLTYKVANGAESSVSSYSAGRAVNFGGATSGLVADGGAASLLYLKRDGADTLVAVAGGGGGAAMSQSGTPKNGDNAVQTLTTDGQKELTSGGTYNVASGGGGGYKSGKYGGMTFGATTYTKFPETYFSNLVHNNPGDNDWYFTGEGCELDNFHLNIPSDTTLEDGYEYALGLGTYGHLSTGSYRYVESPWIDVEGYNGIFWAFGDGDSAQKKMFYEYTVIDNNGNTIMNCSLNTNDLEIGTHDLIGTNYDLKCMITDHSEWFDMRVYFPQGTEKVKIKFKGTALEDFSDYLSVTYHMQMIEISNGIIVPSTGGSCYHDGNLVVSSTFESTMNENTTGYFSIQGSDFSLSTETSTTDKNTPDKAAPDTPVIDENLGIVASGLSGELTNIVLSNIGWNIPKDNGTPYEFRGETWDYFGTDQGTPEEQLRVSTTKNAAVTVTSGVDHYNYKVEVLDNLHSYQGWETIAELQTGANTLENITVKSGVNARNFDFTVALTVTATDKAGNTSLEAKKTLRVSNSTPGPRGHLPGILESPSISGQANTTGNVYKHGSKFYLRADGNAEVLISASAKLDPVNKSQITELALTGSNGSKAGITHQLSDSNVITGGSILGFVLAGEDFSAERGEVSIAQRYKTNKEDTVTLRSFAQSLCCGADDDGCSLPGHNDSKMSADTITLVGDGTPPAVNISWNNGSSNINIGTFSGESNVASTNSGKWYSKDIPINLSVSDNGAGIRSVTVTDNYGVKKAEGSFSGRKTNEELSFTETRDAETTYTISSVDNVGNETVIILTVKINKNNPVIEDKTVGLAGNGSGANVRSYKPGTDILRKNAAGEILNWNKTQEDAQWEYDWADMRNITYTVSDTISGIKRIKFYETNSSYTENKRTIFEKDFGFIARYTVHENVETEGTTYYRLEAEGLSGKITRVNIKVRKDSTAPAVLMSSRTSADFENFTMEEANKAVAYGNTSELFTTWEVKFADWNTLGSKFDSSGIKDATLYIYDANDPYVMKSYPMYQYVDGYSSTLPIHHDFPSPLDGESRYWEKAFHVKVNTFADFPESACLKWYIECRDNLNHVVQYDGKNSSGGDDIMPNFGIKAVGWATKDGAYNTPSDDGKTNTPYFKTGEIGYLETWTIGYVEKLELDFSDRGLGQEAARAISGGILDKKYALGIHDDAPDTARFLDTIKDHGTTSGIPDRIDGVPFATHYVYSNAELNEHLAEGTDNTTGWLSDGTMFRIPPNHELVKKGEKDKYGNDIFVWELNYAKVYGYKGGYNVWATAPYVIWDESGDDVHYRVIHGTLGF